jgi:endoglucanase
MRCSKALVPLACTLIVACAAPEDVAPDDARVRAPDAADADAVSYADGSLDATAVALDASVRDGSIPDASVPDGSPVATHGMLRVVGNRVVGKHGAPVALRGMSLFWSQWSGTLYSASVVATLAREWNANVVRAAMGVDQGGYLTNPDAERARVITVVDAAIAEGIYVIIDWHDHDATQHTDAARAFFVDMATRYGNVPNVLFEVFNEPDYETWTAVKAYAEDVIGAIRATGAENLVIVGSPTWSQDVDVAAANPITNRTNVAYTLHFYAGTHGAALRSKATVALANGLALFVTEWGTCEANGNGNVDLVSSQTWLDFLATNDISAVNWSVIDKNESCAALVPGATLPWSESEVTTSGRFARASLTPGSE